MRLPAPGLVVFIGDGLPFGILPPFGLITVVAQQLSCLALSIGMRHDLAQLVVNKGFAGAVLMITSPSGLRSSVVCSERR